MSLRTLICIVCASLLAICGAFAYLDPWGRLAVSLLSGMWAFWAGIEHGSEQ